jgi:DHA2 family multidrug resistance protein-like MFS transporter
MTTVPKRAGRREWIGLAVIALPCLLYSMDLTVLNLAVPRLSADLRPTSAQLLWIVDIYGFVLAGFLIPMGALGDRIGRRRLLLMGAAAFGIASVLAAFAWSAEMLIATRALLGVAGATLAPSTLSLIRNMFADEHERRFAIGVWVTSYSVGGAIGPLLGGVLLNHFWWGSVFLIGVPVMLLLLAVGPVLLPEYRDPNARRIDFASAVLSLAAVLLVIYGIKRASQGDADWRAAAAMLAGAAVGLAFIRRQQLLEDPLVDLALLRSRAFSTSLAAYTIGTFIAFGVFFFVGQYLQLVLELSPLRAGLASLPFFASFIAGSLLLPAMARRVAAPKLLTAGLVVAAIGAIMIAPSAGESSLAIVIAGFALLALGLAPVFTLATDIIVGAAPAERAGSASAISETGSELGGALGIAVLGSIGTAAYRGTIAHSISAVVPPDSVEAVRRTLGGAVSVAEHLPPTIASQLVDSAREAFSRSLDVVSLTAAGIAIATAILVMVALRSVPPADQR